MNRSSSLLSGLALVLVLLGTAAVFAGAGLHFFTDVPAGRIVFGVGFLVQSAGWFTYGNRNRGRS